MRESPIWRPYTQEGIASEPLRLKSAHGATLVTDEGRELIDGIASWWLITHGHCHPKIAQAVAKQAATLDQVVFANFTHEPAEELAARLVKLTGMSRVFFSDNGSTAVEVALKMALQAQAQSGRERRTKFLALRDAYHGDTVGAMSVSGASAFNRPYRRMTFNVIHASPPGLQHFRELLDQHCEELAALIVEPLVQGAGGMLMWSEEDVREMTNLARERGLYVIFDEVMTGFGRTGAMFAMDKVGVKPDFLCLSKGLTGGTLPLAVTLTHDQVYEAFYGPEKGKLFFHGHSFTGNPLSIAAAVANLRLFEEENTLSRLQEIEAIHRRRLEQMNPKGARVCGTIAAFEMSEEAYTDEGPDIWARKALAEGLFLRPLGGTLYLMPPFSISNQDLERAWDILARLRN